MSDHRMNLGGAGPVELGKTTKKLTMQEVPTVGPEPAAMVPNKKEAIESVTTKSELKCYGCRK